MSHSTSRFRVKPEHVPYRTAEGNVRIGGVVFGIGAEIADPSGWLWTLVQALDGSCAVPAAVALVRARHPGLSERTVAAAVERLNAEGFLESVADSPGQPLLPAPPTDISFSGRERERYSRGVTLQRWMDRKPRRSVWEPQHRLRRSRVLIVGLGGTGSTAAQALVASGVGQVHCLDGDTVELSNLNRQILFTEADLGAPKVDAAVRRLSLVNSDVSVSGRRTAIRDADHLAEVLATPPDRGPDRDPGHETDYGTSRETDGAAEARWTGFDLLLMCADDPPEIRRWANRACLATGTPWVTGGYRGPLATAGVFAPGSGPCWECLRMGERERRELGLAPGGDERLASPRMPWNPVNAVSAGLSGYFIAHAGLALLHGIPPLQPGFRYGTNLMLPGESVLERFPRRPDCPACGTGDPVENEPLGNEPLEDDPVEADAKWAAP